MPVETEGQKRMSWLEKLDERLNVDVDWMDPDYIKSMPIKPHDQTSNQIWLGIQLAHASNAAALKQTAKELAGEGWLAIYSRMAAIMCQKNLDLIKGRVLVQTSPSDAYCTEATVAHARRYDREFRRLNIPRDRFCIKILATGPGLNAARTLQQEGIATLGTAVFSVEQAIACSQAGCLFISPYYNEVRTHENPSLWPNVADPALQHPFSNRIMQMLQVYRQLHQETGRTQPLIKNAAYGSIKEAIATAELGCHSATMSITVIDELAATPYDKSSDPGQHVSKAGYVVEFGSRIMPTRLQGLLDSDPLREGPFVQARTDVDYLSNGGAELVTAMEKDPVGLGRLNDAIALFVRAEQASKELIEAMILAQASSL